jgi:NAD(P) transhydrogenase subunit alpha
MKLGVPKETREGERRVAAVPEVVKKLAARGLAVCVERGAGAAAGYPDDDYAAAGAELTDAATALAADIVVKVRKPGPDEIAALQAGAVHISLIETCEDDGTLSGLLAKDVQAIAMERIPRISRAQSMDEAAAHYGRFLPMMMTAAGAAKPARLVVLGAGVAGLQAIATARRLGAEVWAYDVRPETREQIQSLGAKAIELDIGESGAGEGGYAKELSAEAKARQQQLLADELAKAHVIITTALIPCRPAPVLVTEEVVQRMRDGSVIVDLAAANGGNCPLTEPDRVVERHGVTLVGHTNYPSMVAGDASAFYARNIANLLDIMLESTDAGPALKDLDADEITKAALIRAD